MKPESGYILFEEQHLIYLFQPRRKSLIHGTSSLTKPIYGLFGTLLSQQLQAFASV
jgi:hypothetical protein